MNREYMGLSDLKPLVGYEEYKERNKDLLKGLEFHPRASLLAFYNIVLFTWVAESSLKGLARLLA